MPNREMQNNFDRCAQHYDQYAVIQKLIAKDLVDCVLSVQKKLHCVCDIGAGTGFVGNYLPNNIYYIAVDTSVKMLQQINRPVMNVVASGDNLPFCQKPIFDTIISSMTVPWLSNIRSVLQWQDFLIPNGRIIFTILTSGSFTPLYSALKKINRPDKIIAWLDENYIQSTLNANIIKTKVYHTAPQTIWDFMQSWNIIGASKYPNHNAKPLTKSEIISLKNDATLYQHPYRVCFVEINNVSST